MTLLSRSTALQVAASFLNAYYHSFTCHGDLVEQLHDYYNFHSHCAVVGHPSMESSGMTGKVVAVHLAKLDQVLQERKVEITSSNVVPLPDGGLQVVCLGTLFLRAKKWKILHFFVLAPTPHRINTFYIASEHLCFLSVTEEKPPEGVTVLALNQVVTFLAEERKRRMEAMERHHREQQAYLKELEARKLMDEERERQEAKAREDAAAASQQKTHASFQGDRQEREAPQREYRDRDAQRQDRREQNPRERQDRREQNPRERQDRREQNPRERQDRREQNPRERQDRREENPRERQDRREAREHRPRREDGDVRPRGSRVPREERDGGEDNNGRRGNQDSRGPRPRNPRNERKPRDEGASKSDASAPAAESDAKEGPQRKRRERKPRQRHEDAVGTEGAAERAKQQPARTEEHNEEKQKVSERKPHNGGKANESKGPHSAARSGPTTDVRIANVPHAVTDNEIKEAVKQKGESPVSLYRFGRDKTNVIVKFGSEEAAEKIVKLGSIVVEGSSHKVVAFFP